MTLREFYGWTPTERHFDADGNLVRTVEHEPRFDDAEREAWIARWEYQQELCPDCGNPKSVCSDPNVDNYPQRTVCWVTAGRQVMQRRWDKIHEGDKPDRETGYLPSDGVRLWVSQEDLSPGDDFLASSNHAAGQLDDSDDGEQDA